MPDKFYEFLQKAISMALKDFCAGQSRVKVSMEDYQSNQSLDWAKAHLLDWSN